MKFVSLDNILPTPVSHDLYIFKKVIAKKGDIPHIVQIAQVTLEPGQSVPAHSHPDLYEVFYVEIGQGTVTINDVDQALKAGDVLTIEPGDLHSFQNDTKEELIMFYFGVETHKS